MSLSDASPGASPPQVSQGILTKSCHCQTAVTLCFTYIGPHVWGRFCNYPHFTGGEVEALGGRASGRASQLAPKPTLTSMRAHQTQQWDCLLRASQPCRPSPSPAARLEVTIT